MEAYGAPFPSLLVTGIILSETLQVFVPAPSEDLRSSNMDANGITLEIQVISTLSNSATCSGFHWRQPFSVICEKIN